MNEIGLKNWTLVQLNRWNFSIYIVTSLKVGSYFFLTYFLCACEHMCLFALVYFNTLHWFKYHANLFLVWDYVAMQKRSFTRIDRSIYTIYFLFLYWCCSIFLLMWFGAVFNIKMQKNKRWTCFAAIIQRYLELFLFLRMDNGFKKWKKMYLKQLEIKYLDTYWQTVKIVAILFFWRTLNEKHFFCFFFSNKKRKRGNIETYISIAFYIYCWCL